MDAEAPLDAPAPGEGVEIGIVDTAAGLPPAEAERFTIAEGEDYTDLEAPDPDGHGTLVFGATERFATGATYRFYRLFGAGEVYSTDLLWPLADGRADGVDVLNISAGFRHDDGGNRSLERAIEEVADDMLVVAAAGNERRDPAEAVNYPARYEDVLAVAGYVSRCTGTVGRRERDKRLWVDTADRRGFPDRQGPFCTQEGCSEGQQCDGDRVERTWQGNVEPTAGKPDVQAPPSLPHRDETGPYFVPGTSFATPMVAGIAAWLFEVVEPTPAPPAVKAAIRQRAVPIHDGTKKLNAEHARRRLS